MGTKYCFFNPAAFTAPADFTFGNAPRYFSNLRAPGYVDQDLTLGKWFNFQRKAAHAIRRPDVQRFQPSQLRHTECQCRKPQHGLELEHPGSQTNARRAEGYLLESLCDGRPSLRYVQRFRSRFPTVSGVALAQDHDQTVQSLLAEARLAQSRGNFAQAAEAIERLPHWSPYSRAMGKSWSDVSRVGKPFGGYQKLSASRLG